MAKELRDQGERVLICALKLGDVQTPRIVSEAATVEKLVLVALVLWCFVLNPHQPHARLKTRRRRERNTNELCAKPTGGPAPFSPPPPPPFRSVRF